MANFRHVIDDAYQEILRRPVEPEEVASANARLNNGMTEAQLRESLLRSAEYQQRFPEERGTQPRRIPGDGSAIASLTLSQSKRGFLLNGKPYTIASHGNLVTAVPGHDWRADLALQVSKGESYARLWHMLAGETVEWPWLKVGAKWDLTQWNEAYWKVIREVLTEAGNAGVVVEPHVFDRGCGGSQQDYKSYPWHPDNNTSGLHDQLPTGGTGFPQFYEAPANSKLFNLQAAYVRKWAEECKPFPGVILEIENEKRAGGGIEWARHWAAVIKGVNPAQLVSYSSLEEDLEAAYSVSQIDVICKHFGDEGSDTRVLHDYIARHWSKGKVVNIDEFANGLGDHVLLTQMCETITRNGAHFHIEDSQGSADGYDAAAAMRVLIAGVNPPFCDVGPSGPRPPCPEESKRGWSILYVNREGRRLFTGNTACEKAAREGKLRPGDNIALDSTALVRTQEPVPEGCGTCEERPTKWSHTMGGRSRADGNCGFEVWPEHTGTVTACDPDGKKCVTKQIRIGP